MNNRIKIKSLLVTATGKRYGTFVTLAHDILAAEPKDKEEIWSIIGQKNKEKVKELLECFSEVNLEASFTSTSYFTGAFYVVYSFLNLEGVKEYVKLEGYYSSDFGLDAEVNISFVKPVEKTYIDWEQNTDE